MAFTVKKQNSNQSKSGVGDVYFYPKGDKDNRCCAKKGILNDIGTVAKFKNEMSGGASEGENHWEERRVQGQAFGKITLQ